MLTSSAAAERMLDDLTRGSTFALVAYPRHGVEI